MKINRERRGTILNKRKDYNRNKIVFNKINRFEVENICMMPLGCIKEKITSKSNMEIFLGRYRVGVLTLDWSRRPDTGRPNGFWPSLCSSLWALLTRCVSLSTGSNDFFLLLHSSPCDTAGWRPRSSPPLLLGSSAQARWSGGEGFGLV
jgi:hypothetical protein